jgi:hypothetical protein
MEAFRIEQRGQEEAKNSALTDAMIKYEEIGFDIDTSINKYDEYPDHTDPRHEGDI